jgi:pimeloyl-ACP methyl ester carboxylesterase
MPLMLPTRHPRPEGRSTLGPVSPVIEGAGVALAYEERGSGSPVLLVHGIGEGRRATASAQEAVAGRARAIAYDRRGYGESGAPEPYERTTVEEQAEDAAALLRGLDVSGAVCVGRDFGALVCLDLLRRHGGLVGSAVLADPWLFALTPGANEALAAERDRLEGDLREHGPGEAVRRFGRDGDEHRGFFADYGGTAAWGAGRRDLRAISAPVAVVVSDAAPAHVRAAAEALAALLPGARLQPGEDPLAALDGLLP